MESFLREGFAHRPGLLAVPAKYDNPCVMVFQRQAPIFRFIGLIHVTEREISSAQDATSSELFRVPSIYENCSSAILNCVLNPIGLDLSNSTQSSPNWNTKLIAFNVFISSCQQLRCQSSTLTSIYATAVNHDRSCLVVLNMASDCIDVADVLYSGFRSSRLTTNIDYARYMVDRVFFGGSCIKNSCAFLL